LSLPIFELVSATGKTSFVRHQRRYNIMILDCPERQSMLIHDNIGEATYRRFPAWILA